MNRAVSLKVILCSIAFAVWGVSGVYANDPGMDMHQGACKADAEKLCPGMQPGQGAIRDCLKQHEAELSADCKSHMAMMKEKMKEHKKEIQAACKADTEQFCKDVTPGEGREIACLHAHSDKISAGCKAVVMKHHPMHGTGTPPAGTMEKK